jgi:hypothetical protein
MNPPAADRAPHTGWYRIRVKGHLAARWSTRFDGMALTPQDDGTTLIQGPVVDQAALHGLLQQIRDTGLPLMSVTQADPEHPPDPGPGTTSPSQPANNAPPTTRRQS